MATAFSRCREEIEGYQEALKHLTLDQSPIDYAMTQYNLGNAFQTLARMEPKAKDCRLAIEAYSRALNVFSREQFPREYANTKSSLGYAYWVLSGVTRDEEKKQNCLLSIAACSEASKVITVDVSPTQYAEIQYHIGQALWIFAWTAEGTRKMKTKYGRLCTEAYTEVLKSFPPENLPADYAILENYIRILEEEFR